MWRVLEGRCEDVIPTIPLKFDLIFADPPFNIGQPYKGYQDSIDPGEYKVWTLRWVAACWDALKPNGVLCLHGPDALAEAYLEIARTLGMGRIGWVNWHYRFAQCHESNWLDSRTHCLIFAKGAGYKWRPDSVVVTSDRVQYGDKRTGNTARGGKRLPFNVWGIPSDGPHWGRVVGANKERRSHNPNQLPEVYLGRLISAYTDAGDLVLDPFCGTGTTACVAHALGRNAVTIDVCPINAAAARERIAGGLARPLNLEGKAWQDESARCDTSLSTLNSTTPSSGTT